MKLKQYSSITTAKIVSVLFAAILWFHVATQAVYNQKAYIPIRYIDPSSGYMLASSPPEEIMVNISGSGKNLILFNLMHFFDPEGSFTTVNLTGLPKGRHRINLDKNNIFLSIEKGITIENILYNSFFPVVIDNKIKRTVKVNLDSIPHFELENGSVLNGQLTSTPEFVTVEGPEDIINTIHTATIHELEDTVIALQDSVVHAKLDDTIRFVVVDPDEIDIHFPVEKLLTKLFRDVPLTKQGFPKRKNLMLKPDTLSVFIQGPESIVSKLRSEDIVVTVNYKNYRDQIAQGDSLIVPKINYPKGITSASITPGVLRISDNSPGS